MTGCMSQLALAISKDRAHLTHLRSLPGRRSAPGGWKLKALPAGDAYVTLSRKVACVWPMWRR